MAAALPPISDCGCSCQGSSSGGGGGGGTDNDLYPLHGTLDPNTAGVVPPYSLGLIWVYQQWVDAIAGPPIATWWWNPNLSLWQ